MAGNLRRTKTEQLHLRKELSARYSFKACVSFFRGRRLGFGLVLFGFGLVFFGCSAV